MTFPMKMKAMNVAAPQTQSVMRSAVTPLLISRGGRERERWSERSVRNLKPVQQSGHSPMNSPGVGRETPWVSIVFAVLFRRSLGVRPRSYIVPTGRHVESWRKGVK